MREDFADFFAKGGVIVESEAEQIASYRADPRPEIHVNRERYAFAREPNGAYSAVGLFSTLAHEVGHDKDKHARFKVGGTAEEYVQFRSEKEAKAIFNAFPIFADLSERVPEFRPSWREVGYDTSGLKWGSLFGDWKRGDLSEAGMVKEIAAQVARFPYSRTDGLTDQDRDGVLTQRDLYLRDYQRLLRDSSQAPAQRVGAELMPAINPSEGAFAGPDAVMHRQARSGVAGLGSGRAAGDGESAERFAASLVALAKENGLIRIDHVVLSRGGVGLSDGDNVFVVEGRLDDPAHLRAHMKTEQALQTPIETSVQRVEAVNVENARLQAQQVVAQDSQEVGRSPVKH
ncbi:XVIPCD domain-containing protein [Lysobacter sp. CA199]|uniref:XVIPCD domain-containing protein n=1 Tax=Lysobacter sp. CA199 TaxID=3455608 RepID=UPI003F8CFA9F